MALTMTNLRFLDQFRGGRAPGAEVSMLKIKGTEIQQGLTELMMQAAGPLAQAVAPGRRRRDAPTMLRRVARAALLQHPQDDDLRRLERDPAQHHRQAGARALTRDELRPHRGTAAARRLDRALRRARLRFRDTRRKIVASADGCSRDVWKTMAELGLLGLPLPVEYGGFGGGAVDAMA